MTRPPTWGTTARLAGYGLAAVLALSTGYGGLLAWLVLHAAPDILPDALESIAAAIGPAMLALGAIATGGAAIHGARHVGPGGSPTSADLRGAMDRPGPSLADADR